MVFLKYFLLNFLFLFSEKMSFANVAIFSLISLIFVLIVEINENIYYSLALSVIFLIIIYFFPEFRFFMFSFIYAIYSKSIYNIPIFLVFLLSKEINFFALSLLIVCLSQYDRELYERKVFYHREFLNFYKTNYKLQKDLKKLYLEEEKKNYDSILKEREKISKELHNSIGHTISASILELRALELICDDEEIKTSVIRIRENLSGGLVDIRKIIHNMYKSAFNLESSIEKIINVPNVKSKLIYRVKTKMNENLSFDILSIVKEAFSNFIKHSNGDSFTVRIIENENSYIITIFDNGKNINIEKNDGLGILSMEEIAKKYNGLFNVITDDGFKINIAIDKGENNENFNG